MKKRYVFLGLLVAGTLFAACDKEHQCKCFKADIPDDVIETEMIFTIDGSTSCDDLILMGYEEHVATEGGQTLHRVDTHPLKCREYGD